MDKILKDFKKKEHMLNHCLTNLHNMYVADFKNHTEETYLSLQGKSEDISASLVTYNDHYRKLMSKLMGVAVDKNLLFDLCNYVISANKQQLSDTKADITTLKLKFDEICKYSSKSVEACKYYDDPLFCAYVASKTFKKTAVEVFEFLYYALDLDEYLKKTYFNCTLEYPEQSLKSNPCPDDKSLVTGLEARAVKPKKIACDKASDWMKKGVKIVSIGGGPGNDCLAVYTYIMACHSKKLSPNTKCCVEIYDLNHIGWQESHQATLEKYYKGRLSIKWGFTDHLNDYTLGQLQADFITICWTLNENLGFNKNYWNQLIKSNMNAIYVVIEGERRNVDLLVEIFEKYEFRHIYYENDASPRKLIAHY